jgi:hypothetical protein
MSIWSSLCQQCHKNDEELSTISLSFHHHNEGDDLSKHTKYFNIGTPFPLKKCYFNIYLS